MAPSLFVGLTVFYFSEYQPHGPTAQFPQLISDYIWLLEDPVEAYVGRDRPLGYYPVICLGLVVMLGWPQLAFALMGGFLSQRYKVTIGRR
jgi:hypothetical protein